LQFQLPNEAGCYNPKTMNDRTLQRLQAIRGRLRTPIFKVLLAIVLFILIGVTGVGLYYYNYYSRMIDRRLSGEIFENTARIYAAPYFIYTGQKLSPDAVVGRLQRAGFEPNGAASAEEGTYELSPNRVTIRPAVGDPLRLEFQKNVLTRIVKLDIGNVDEAWLPAELVTNLFDQESRRKRRVVEFNELPPVLVNALIAAEDHRFYSHWGIDPIRLAGALVASIRNSDRVEGVSTLTQQFARNFFLTSERSIKRKMHEAFVALLLERRLTKQQILTMYANEVYLGQRGSFSIHGFAEGAAAIFGKDLTAIELPEAATLAGMLPAPNSYSPIKYPDRAKSRRNVVLNRMADVGFITREEAEKAKKAKLEVAPMRVDATDAPYLVDFIREQLLKDFSEDTLIHDNLRVYTSLDPDLQRAAVDAVEKGLRNVEQQLAQRNKGRKNAVKLPPPQAALVALDRRTARILAMVGGGDYGASQYNRITQAFRQPGSIFKPFVFAAAFAAALDGPLPQTEIVRLAASADPALTPVDPQPTSELAVDYITPITPVMDEETVFLYDRDKIYEPNNYHQEYHGAVTVRTALQKSLNIPTIKIAERIGYDRVADLARRAGMNAKIKGYPSVALGAFEVTPLEMAGAYTVFANEGKRLEPHAVLRVVSGDGSIKKTYKHEETQVLAPEVAYLMTHLMEGVIDSGTGQGVRSRGFWLPAAGKTGTSRDGWFAGYTKDYIVIAWVGYDDNRDLNLEGARSALPIWTDFMIKAYQLYPPRDPDAMYFEPPEGVDFVRIDRESNLPATSACVDTYEEAFLSAAVPSDHCPLHTPAISEIIENGVTETGKGVANAAKGIGRFFGRIFGGGNDSKDR